MHPIYTTIYTTTRQVRFPNPAFDLDLYGALFRPDAAKYGPGPYPTIVSVYGGPHVQVKNATALHIPLGIQFSESFILKYRLKYK